MQALWNGLHTRLLRFARIPYIKTSEVPSLDLSRAPLYERSPPWWLGARSAWITIGGCLVAVPFECEFVWSNWTKRALRDEGLSAEGSAPSPETSTEFVLRPVWQRALLASGVAVFNLGSIFALVWSRSRLIRKLYILPPAPCVLTGSKGLQSEARVFFQSAAHSEYEGMLYPKRLCHLRADKDAPELILKAAGVRGDFRMLLDPAKIHGKAKSSKDAGSSVMGHWLKEKVAREHVGGWKDGPVTRKHR